MRLVGPILLALAAFAATAAVRRAPAGAATTPRASVDDVGVPFWCNWPYSDERCYLDTSSRLPLSAVDEWENFSIGALSFPSVREADRAALPKLVVTYWTATSAAG